MMQHCITKRNAFTRSGGVTIFGFNAACLQQVHLTMSALSMYYLATYKFIYILPTKYPGLDELNFSEFTLHLRACLSSDLVTGFTSPSFATIAKSVLRTKLC